MNRIIITENDLTSNVESLSSYDVVYVPGFGNPVSTVDGTTNTFRDPQLYTSKYDFQNAYGSTPPTFKQTQYYNPNDWGDYDIPDAGTTNTFEAVGTEYSGDIIVDDTKSEENAQIKSVDATGVGLTTFIASECIAISKDTTLSEASTQVFVRTNESQDDGSKELSALANVNGIYLVAVHSSHMGLIATMDNAYFYINPTENDWYKPSSTTTGEYVAVKDTTLDPSNWTNYYYMKSTNPVWVESGFPDYGYRYAKLLLSMGIPVYYEQMNSETMEEHEWEEDDDYADRWSNGEVWLKNPMYNEGSKEVDEYIIPTTKPNTGDTVYIGAPMQINALYLGLIARFTEVDEEEESVSPSTGLEIDNMGDYTIKYFTSGGYPLFGYKDSGLAETFIEACTSRGDAIALIDHTNNPDRPIVASNKRSVAYAARNWTLESVAGSYGAMFTPWYECSSPIVQSLVNNEDYSMPASLAYLTALARQIQNYNPWLAVSGVSRGVVPYFDKLHINRYLSNNIADSYQLLPSDNATNPSGSLRSINPITYIRNYGYCIWGNRTLRSASSGTKATNFLSTRNQVSDIKKCIYETSQKMLFEQNSDVLWINWKSYVTPLLEQMLSNNILSDYTITKYNIDPESGEQVPAYKILAAIRIVPINSVEQFELTVNIENDTADVVEEE